MSECSEDRSSSHSFESDLALTVKLLNRLEPSPERDELIKRLEQRVREFQQLAQFFSGQS
jgi:hypothetical protein